jgi:hypothetical protein
MNTSNAKDAFAPGFRLSVLDVIVLVVGAVVASTLAQAVWWWGLVVGFVLGHFFLFCNVVRMARLLELAWAGIFVALAAATIVLDVPGWAITFSTSLFATLVLVVLQIRTPSYHGVGWQWFNPGLPAWWEARQAERSGR